MEVKIFQFNPIGENTYLLYDETKESVLIDAGCFFPEEKQTLLTFISGNGLKITHLLNTHLHFDHVMGNAFINEKFGIHTQAHRDDEFLLEGLPAQMRMFGFQATENIPEIARYLEDGDTIKFGKQLLKVLYVPGHSPGSLAFYSEEAGCVFVGDVLFQSSIGRTDLAGGNFDQLIESIRTKLLTLPPETIVYPGHGPKTTIASEIKNNPYLN